jgi:tRNA U34 2-thiouridine synthase MnmA/TrmU
MSDQIKSYRSKQHELNSNEFVRRKKSSKMPCKTFNKEELNALATSMGLQVSPDAGKSEIDFSKLPASFQKFAPKARK